MLIEVPPMPDRETGQPHPPSAPIPLADVTEAGEDEKGRADKRSAPPGYGPTLEAYGITSSTRWVMAVTMVVIMLVFMLLREGSLWWITHPAIWGVIAVFFLLILFGYRNSDVFAGADWYGTMKRWVSTYELTEVGLSRAWATYVLDLRDVHGNKVSMSLRDVCANRRLWNLVFNGILHSVVHGKAELNELAWRKFEFPDEYRPRD